MVFEVRSTQSEPLSTFFAPAERSSDLELRLEAEQCMANPVACFLMDSMDGLVLILDGNRQVLATNDRVRDVVGSAVETMGHRPGELFGCIHHQEGPGGCGTGAACAHCGAVAAILEVQRTGRAVEGECLHTLRSGEHTQSAEFELAASPLQVGPHTFIVVVLHDQSATKRRESLERLFYHDVANLMQGIRGWADLLASGSTTAPGTAQKLAHLTDLLDRELRSHRAMAQAELGELQPKLRAIQPQEILRDVSDLLTNHALAGNRHAGHDQWLRIHITIHSLTEDFPEVAGSHAGGGQAGFIEVRPGAGVVVVIGEDIDTGRPAERGRQADSQQNNMPAVAMVNIHG